MLWLKSVEAWRRGTGRIFSKLRHEIVGITRDLKMECRFARWRISLGIVEYCLLQHVPLKAWMLGVELLLPDWT